MLIPSYLRNTLLAVATEGVYRPLWSTQIWVEVVRNTPKVSPNIDMEKASKRFERLRQQFCDAMVEGWQSLESAMTNPQGDRHVLAAAVAGNADGIVTENLKDFPEESRQPYGLALHSPDDFLLDQLDLDPAAVLRAIGQQAAVTGYGNLPKLSSREILEKLRKKVPNFAAEASTALPRWGLD